MLCGGQPMYRFDQKAPEDEAQLEELRSWDHELQGPLPVVDDYKKLSWILSVVGAAPSKKCRVVGRSSRKSGLS